MSTAVQGWIHLSSFEEEPLQGDVWYSSCSIEVTKYGKLAAGYRSCACPALGYQVEDGFLTLTACCKPRAYSAENMPSNVRLETLCPVMAIADWLQTKHHNTSLDAVIVHVKPVERLVWSAVKICLVASRLARQIMTHHVCKAIAGAADL